MKQVVLFFLLLFNALTYGQVTKTQSDADGYVTVDGKKIRKLHFANPLADYKPTKSIVPERDPLIDSMCLRKDSVACDCLTRRANINCIYFNREKKKFDMFRFCQSHVMAGNLDVIQANPTCDKVIKEIIVKTAEMWQDDIIDPQMMIEQEVVATVDATKDVIDYTSPEGKRARIPAAEVLTDVGQQIAPALGPDNFARISKKLRECLREMEQ